MVENNELNERKTNNRKSQLWLVIGISLLVLIIALCIFLSRENGPQEGMVVIKAGDETLGSFSIDDLRELPAVEKKMKLKTNCSFNCNNNGSNDSSNSEDNIIEHEFTGTPLLDVLNSIDPELPHKYKKIITRGADYYSQVLEMSEVIKPDNVYIVYADYGKPLQTQTGEEGSLQAVICNDQSEQRFTKWLISLELQ